MMSTSIDIELQIEALKGFNIIERLNNIKNPTLLLAASHDKVCTKNAMQEIHQRIPDSIFRIIEKAGHESPKTRAIEVNSIIIDFLKN